MEKRARLKRGFALRYILSNHPNAKKQLQLLSKDETIKKALELYREVTAMDKNNRPVFPVAILEISAPLWPPYLHKCKLSMPCKDVWMNTVQIVTMAGKCPLEFGKYIPSNKNQLP
jgi:hypothetical protein